LHQISNFPIPSGELTPLPHSLAGGEGACCPSPRTGSPRSRPFRPRVSALWASALWAEASSPSLWGKNLAPSK